MQVGFVVAGYPRHEGHEHLREVAAARALRTRQGQVCQVLDRARPRSHLTQVCRRGHEDDEQAGKHK